METVDPTISESQHLNADRGAAFFDLDRTLIPGSSVFTLASVAWRSGHLSTRQLLHDAWEALTFRTSGATDGKTEKTRQRILGAIKGQDAYTLQKLSSQVIPKLVAQVRPESLALIHDHQLAGRPTYIVSASPIEIVEPLALALGMTGGIGTHGEVVDDCYTGELIGPFCYGNGKVVAIMELARDCGYDLSQSYSYSDAASDLPMLESTKFSTAVNPDHELSKIARERGYPIVRFDGVKQRDAQGKIWGRREQKIAIALSVGAVGFGIGRRTLNK
ncbi:MAG: HAD-IB family hydrolase [Ilumatobacteraceae bacterium]|nr:HAD-IB family hydrolase [Ilumatobacteraceae bacterium]